MRCCSPSSSNVSGVYFKRISAAMQVASATRRHPRARPGAPRFRGPGPRASQRLASTRASGLPQTPLFRCVLLPVPSVIRAAVGVERLGMADVFCRTFPQSARVFGASTTAGSGRQCVAGVSSSSRVPLDKAHRRLHAYSREFASAHPDSVLLLFTRCRIEWASESKSRLGPLQLAQRRRRVRRPSLRPV